MLSINSNLASLDAQLRLSRTQTDMAEHMSHLSSGLRINSAADDPAGLGVSVGFDTQVRSFNQAARNTNDGLSMMQTVDGALGQIHGALQRMRELAVESASGTYATADRTNIQAEFSNLQSEINRITNSTYFGNVQLLSAASTVTLQVGSNNSANDTMAIAFSKSDTTTLGVNTSTVATQTDSTAAITNIDTAIQTVSTSRANIGAQENRLGVALNNDQSFSTNLGAALSRIRDADVASESAALAKDNVLAQAGVAVLAQANQQPNLALSLLH